MRITPGNGDNRQFIDRDRPTTPFDQDEMMESKQRHPAQAIEPPSADEELVKRA